MIFFLLIFNKEKKNLFSTFLRIIKFNNWKKNLGIDQKYYLIDKIKILYIKLLCPQKEKAY